MSLPPAHLRTLRRADSRCSRNYVINTRTDRAAGVTVPRVSVHRKTKEARPQARQAVQEVGLGLDNMQVTSEPDGQQKDMLSELERLHSWHALFIETNKSCPRCWEQILQASNDDQDKGED